MKTIKFKNKFIKYGLALTVLASVTSCSVDSERNINDEYGQTQEQQMQGLTIVKAPLENLMSSIVMVTPEWQFQLQQNLMGDVFSGYMAPPTPFAGDSNNTHYNLVDGWNQYPWTIAYTGVLPNAFKVENRAAQLNLPQFLGIAKILKVEGMHRISDIYGPIIYSHFGENAAGDKFDTQKEAYYAFFADLDAGIAALKDAQNKGLVLDPSADISAFGGNLAKWIKFGNSLRLRLALRISGVDPVKAKTEGEKALSDLGGLMSNNTENFIVNKPNPLGVINSWGDTRMGASMESILNGLQDPRVGKYFTKNTFSNSYTGIRQGIDITAHGGKDSYVKNSGINSDMFSQIQLMTASEVQFLIAEAKLKNWNTNGISSETAYNNGIQLSFAQYGLTAGSYITNTSNTPANYVDAFNPDNNINAASQVTIAWNNADTDALKLEKIITQKWISGFPDGQEAWSEFRRTGYPKLFPVKLNKSGGLISTTEFIKRINFPASEKSTNPTNVSAAVGMLGGPDNGGTNLWWDVN
ncbi:MULTISPECIES: SusD/RagB family nutrient-binding outer membrane lipoprotein [Amniculibacterium]|uniref:SusD/RagB family nutrient-binding outer membrane lipoprotein n=1 Tax=Amniculibacterium TaxID=2715289 RepID=UPI000F5985C9|nr:MULTISPECIES: SusD/RagB family nutrient-binding outer membrane lipoprotein [Amniculibacterium]